ncbi:MAG: SsrA-binding protein SmpB [Sphaerochaetaceae bacterium]|nr:SsrA-binding protein SmpB [Sphaerochaetaceae bacterium]
MADDKTKINVLQTNKKAYFNYQIVDDLEAGISLEGTEVKSLRQGKFSFGDSYIKIIDGELILTGFTIQPYDKGSIFNHKSDRDRRLLVHKQEIKRLKRKTEEKGFTLVPTKVYLKGNRVKIQVSLAKGKDLHDKKEAIKERDIDRQARREARDFFK